MPQLNTQLHIQKHLNQIKFEQTINNSGIHYKLWSQTCNDDKKESKQRRCAVRAFQACMSTVIILEGYQVFSRDGENALTAIECWTCSLVAAFKNYDGYLDFMASFKSDKDKEDDKEENVMTHSELG